MGRSRGSGASVAGATCVDFGGGGPGACRLRWLSTSADTQGDGRPLCEAASLCMKLVQILLPVRDNHGRKFKPILYAKIHKQLIKCFGGLTAHTRSPARGLWNSEGSTKRDDMIILEVMTKRA